MTVDKQKLKVLAEALGGPEWIYAEHDDCEFVESPMGFVAAADNAEFGRFIAAASPATVLALLAEIDEMALEPAKHSRRLIEQLRAENQSLREHKQHLIDLRETQGFDSWVAALVEIDRLKAQSESLRSALAGVIDHVEGNTECLVRDLVNWGTPKVDANEFYDECRQIKAIAQAALDAAMAKAVSHD